MALWEKAFFGEREKFAISICVWAILTILICDCAIRRFDSGLKTDFFKLVWSQCNLFAEKAPHEKYREKIGREASTIDLNKLALKFWCVLIIVNSYKRVLIVLCFAILISKRSVLNNTPTGTATTHVNRPTLIRNGLWTLPLQFEIFNLRVSTWQSQLKTLYWLVEVATVDTTTALSAI